MGARRVDTVSRRPGERLSLGQLYPNLSDCVPGSNVLILAVAYHNTS